MFLQSKNLLVRVWLKLTAPHAAIQNPQARREARLLSILLLAFTPMAFIIAITQTILSENMILALVIGLSATLGNIFCYLLSRTQYYRVSALLIIADASFFCFVGMFTPPHQIEIIYFLSLSSVLAISFLSPRMALLVNGINLFGAFFAALVIPEWTITLASRELIFLSALTIVITIVIASRQYDLYVMDKQADELRQESRELKILLQIDREMTYSLDMNYVLPLALDAAMRLSNAQAGFIALVNDNEKDMSVFDAIGDYPTQTRDWAGQISPVVQAVHQKSAVFIADTATEPAYRGLIPTTQAHIVIPLLAHQEFVGVLNLETARKKNFTPENLELLKLLSSRIATTLDNVRMYDTEKQFRRIIEEARDAVAVTDLSGRFTYVNPHAEKLTGYPAKLLIGTSYMTLIPPEQQHRFRDFYNNQLKQKLSETSYEGEIITATGEIKWVEQITILQTRESKTLGFQSIIRDITARKQAELALEARNRELTAYAHTIAHDLKNPLTVIHMYASILDQDYGSQIPAEAHEFIQEMQKSSRKMIDTTTQLLHLAKLRDAQASVTSLDMNQVAESASSSYKPALKEKNITLHIEPNLPAALGHAAWVEEVFANLISNAIKYMGNPPQPTITIQAIKQTGLVRYEVCDTGIGIKDEDQARLFEMFTRLHPAEAEGFGLGLSIVHRIVTNLKGRVGVESTPGKGSTFWFTLPAA